MDVWDGKSFVRDTDANRAPAGWDYAETIFQIQETQRAVNAGGADPQTAINTANIATNTANIATNVANIATNTANIATNVTNIATNVTNIATNVTDIATNVTNIATNVTDIATNVTNIATNVTDIATNAADIATNVTNITTNTNNILTNTNAIAAIREVTTGGVAGQVLTTDGTNYAWQDIDSLPTQTGHAGEFLTTDATTASWTTIRQVTTGGVAGQVLTTDGSSYSWANGSDTLDSVCDRGSITDQEITAANIHLPDYSGALTREFTWVPTDASNNYASIGAAIFIGQIGGQYAVFSAGTLHLNSTGTSAVQVNRGVGGTGGFIVGDGVTDYMHIQPGSITDTTGQISFNTLNLVTTGSITATAFIGNLTGNADTVTTNANLTGDVVSVGNATVLDPLAIHGKNPSTIIPADYLLFWDDSDSLLKKVSADELLLPDQTGHAGEFLTTDATTESWTAILQVPSGGSLGDLLIKQTVGYSWSTLTNSVITVGGITSSGDVKVSNDSHRFYAGAANDYSIYWNGSNAVHTITAGAFNFDGGAIRLPTFTTTERDALSPVNGFIIYNSTTTQAERYEAGSWTGQVPGGSAGEYEVLTWVGDEWQWIKSARIVTSAESYYVKTTGNDATGDGSSGSPWATIDKALDVIGDWILLASVYIYTERGNYPATSMLSINNPEGGMIQIHGDYETDTATLSSSSGSSGAWSLTFTTTNTSYYTVNDMVLIYAASGGVNPHRVAGTMKVSSINTGVSVTLLSPIATATMATGAVSASISIPQVRWNRPIHFTENFGRLEGIQVQYNCTSTSFVLINTNTVNFSALEISWKYSIIHNTNAVIGGKCRCYPNCSIYVNYTGFSGLHQGMFCYANSLFSSSDSGAINCTTGYQAYGNAIIASVRSHFISCTNGAYISLMSLFTESGGGLLLEANATDSSPAQNTEGNQNSYMAY